MQPRTRGSLTRTGRVKPVFAEKRLPGDRGGRQRFLREFREPSKVLRVLKPGHRGGQGGMRPMAKKLTSLCRLNQ